MFSLFSIPVDIRGDYYNYHPDAYNVANNSGSFISRLLPNIIVLCGVIALFYTAKSGFNMITAAGKGIPADLSKARMSLFYSFAGLLLVAATYFILQIVSTVTGVDFINMSGIL